MVSRIPLGSMFLRQQLCNTNCIFQSITNPTYLHQAPSSSQHFFHTTTSNFGSELAKLRKRTGYSLSICKNALSECNNDVSLAEKWLKDQAQAQGWAKAQKLQGRNTSQGLLGVKIQKQVAAIVELNCETDFVARNKKFIQLLDEISTVCIKENQTIIEDGLERKLIGKEQVQQLTDGKGKTLADLVALSIGQIGENIALGKVTLFQAGEGVRLAGLSHPSPGGGDMSQLQSGRYASLLAYRGEGQAVQEGTTVEGLARQVCQHIIGMAPLSVNNDEDKENSLLHQDFLLDEDLKVGDILQTSGLEVLDFVRLEVGRGDTEE
jgi:elongation factor Ts